VLGLRSGPSPGLIFPFCRRADFGRCSRSESPGFLTSRRFRLEVSRSLFLASWIRLCSTGHIAAARFFSRRTYGCPDLFPLFSHSRVIATVGDFCRRVLFSRCPEVIFAVQWRSCWRFFRWLVFLPLADPAPERPGPVCAQWQELPRFCMGWGW
jgi:hypothetical protein